MDARVLVVDSHPITRWGLCHLIDDQPDLTVVGDTASVREAVALTTALQPDVVTIGLAPSEPECLALARELRERFDDLGLIILASDDDLLLPAFESGVSAYVATSAPVSELVAAVRHAAVAASSFTAAGLAAALRRRDAAASNELSSREQQVLDHLVAGFSVPSLAAVLHISPSTAKTYVARLYEKLGARNRAEAVMAAVRQGLVDGSPTDLLPA
jgi:DNA-binding NarL/FixJ family response regulator